MKPFSEEPSFAGGYGWQAVEMPWKPPLTRFISRPAMSPSCVFRAYNAPYNAFIGVLNVPRTFAETLQGTLSPSAALYSKSAVEYLMNLLVAA